MCQIIIGQCVQLSLDNVSNQVNVRKDFFAPVFFHLNLILSNQMWFVRHRRCQRCQLSAPLVLWWWWFFTDNNTTPTKVILSCYGLLVGLCQYVNRYTTTIGSPYCYDHIICYFMNDCLY
jgi:hypothetical protein